MPNTPFDKMTPDLKKAFERAEQEARELNSSYVGTEHLLLGILLSPQSLAVALLQNMGISAENIRIIIPACPPEAHNPSVAYTLSEPLRGIIEAAFKIAFRHHHNFVGSEHILSAMLEKTDCAAAIALQKMNVPLAEMQKQLQEIFAQMSSTPGKMSPNSLEEFLQGLTGALVSLQRNADFRDAFRHKNKKNGTPQNMNAQNNPRNNGPQNQEEEDESETPALDFFSLNLNDEVRNGKIDPIIGRAKEIERVIHILNRKTKNNPVLIGEPGVGKTAIVEGLAEAIVRGNVPDALLEKKVLI